VREDLFRPTGERELVRSVGKDTSFVTICHKVLLKLGEACSLDVLY